MSTVIKVENLSKKYTICHQQRERYTALRDVIANKARMAGKRMLSALYSLRLAPCSPPSALCAMPSALIPSREDFWALKDVSFEVKQGEVVGIIGRNGAGKSTLLKILSRITEPTTGSVKIKGRIASLLEVGTGFHPELTGRENVYLNGAILGMTKAEIKRKFDEIVAFAEIEKFLDTPVKRYSSGMYVRLAFAVAAHLEPEILVIDEVLAVGDVTFQKKCINKMGDMAKGGRTVLLVSHNMGIVSTLTERVVFLQRGHMKYQGDTPTAINKYLGDGAEKGGVDLRQHPNRLGGMNVALISARLTNKTGRDKDVFLSGEDWYLEIQYSCDNDVKLAGAGFIIETSTGMRVGGLNTYMCTPPPHRIPSHGMVRFCLPNIWLGTGNYLVSISIGTHPNYLYDKVEHAIVFSVEKSDVYGTGYMLTPEDGVYALKGTYEIIN